MSSDLPLKREYEASEDAVKRHKLAQQERAKKVVQESEVGITEYINEINRKGGFYGLFKTLYSDFLVNEIQPDGTVVHLNDEGIDLGKTHKEKALEKRQQKRAELQGKTPEEVEKIKEETKLQEAKTPKYELSDENKAKLLELITPEELQNIEDLFSNGSKTETKSTFADKQVRGSLHQLLRIAFQGKLETTTSDQNTFIVTLAKKGGSQRGRRDESITHVDENGVLNYGLGPFKNYLHFTVYKENRETMEVASTISKLLRCPIKNISFAGTKDRRAVSCQRFSIYKGKVVRVNSLNNGLRSARIGGLSYEDDNLSLGSLSGNEFVITIRDLKPINEGANVEEDLAKSFESLKTNGFINYYGMQRFGTFSISTHVLGIHVLKSEWKEAAELILSEQDIVAPESVEARRIWAESKDADAALQKMPRRFTAEHSILSVLVNEKKLPDNSYNINSYFKGLMGIPRNLRLMYAHAYQSYVWNVVASERIKMFGLEVQEGDLVLITAEEAAAKRKELEDEDFKEDVLVDTHVRARPLTKEEVSKYTIFDVVLPLPGFDVIYPENPKLKQVYVDTMAKDGLDPDKMRRNIREFSLTGSYRAVMSKPGNLSYKIVNYEHDDKPIVRTDLEILQLKKEDKEADIPRIIESDGPKKAVVLTMQLSTSSYATMALREFMKKLEI